MPLGTASAVVAYRQKDDKSPVLGRPHRSWLERVDSFQSKIGQGGGGWRGLVVLVVFVPVVLVAVVV